jgi:hypothetical protein
MLIFAHDRSFAVRLVVLDLFTGLDFRDDFF